jgi:hypothetical protein
MTGSAFLRAPRWLPPALTGLVVGALTTGLVMSTPTAARHPASGTAGAAMESSRGVAHARPAALARGASTTSAPLPRTAQPTSARVAADIHARDPAGGRPSYEQLLATNRALQAQNARLERDAGERGAPRAYDLSAGELEQMAATCELRWDIPSLTMNPTTLSDGEVAKLSLTGSERTIIDRAFAEAHARLVGEVRQTYAALTGDDNPGSMSPEAMYAEVVDKVPEGELQVMFQRLARERAGLAPGPTTASISPLERMFRALTTGGDRLENDLAAALDAQLARAVRDLNGGWSSKFGSSYGCPK